MMDVLMVGLLAIVVYMVALWAVSLILRNASIVDIFWGPGFGVVSLVYFALTPDGYLPRKLLILGMVLIWGLRLGLHIGWRNRGKGEDYRYANWREANGRAWWWKSFFQVFLLQGMLLWLISTPLLAAQYAAQPQYFTLFDGLGLLVWLVGFSFEAIGDWQLTRFRSNPANLGKVLRGGLWRFTRHPNYFGDALLWWGYWLVALSTPFGLLTTFAPLMMTVLLMRVSGVTLLERRLRKSKSGYSDYVETTNAFFPGLPRKRRDPSENLALEE